MVLVTHHVADPTVRIETREYKYLNAIGSIP
jgi:hypothetical protein